MKYLFIFDSPPSRGYDNWVFGECAKLGIHRAEVDTLHLTEVIPVKAGQRPTAKQISDHAHVFYPALAAADADVIVPFGPDCSRAVLGSKQGIESLRGYVFVDEDLGVVKHRESVEDGVYKSGKKKGEVKLKNVIVSEKPVLPTGAIVIPTYSVAYILQKRRKPMFAFAQDLRRAWRANDGSLYMDDALFDTERNFHTKPVIGWEPKNDKFAYDIETAAIAGGYSREPRSFAGVSLSDGVTSMSLDWNEETRDYVRQYLGNPKYTKYAHNSMFDSPRLRDAGAAVVGPVRDTMIMAQLLQPDLLKRLETQASVYLSLKQWKKESESDPYYYSAKDSFVTMLLAEHLEARLDASGMTALSHTIGDALPTLLAMNEEGIKVDVARAQAWASRLEDELITLGASWYAATSPAIVSPSSPRALHKYLYGTLGMQLQRNASDGSTVDAEALFNLKVLYPQHAAKLEILTQYRTVAKQFGTYAKTLAGLQKVGEDRVHPQYLPGGSEGETFGAKGGASTGRLGVREPNIQNQTPEARLMYAPDHAGQVFLEFDFSQAELRVIAALSRDENLQRALAADIHQVTADRLGVPRGLAKNTLYASCYLGGAKTIQTMMKKKGQIIDIATIKAAQDRLRAEYPRMFAWQQATIIKGTSQGYLTNPFGRTRFFYGGRDDSPEMADFLPQSIVADICWELLPEIDAWARANDGRLVTQVHDSFLVSVRSDGIFGLHAIIGAFREMLERTFDQVAPGFMTPVSVKVGKPGQSWGELEKETVNA